MSNEVPQQISPSEKFMKDLSTPELLSQKILRLYLTQLEKYAYLILLLSESEFMILLSKRMNSVLKHEYSIDSFESENESVISILKSSEKKIYNVFYSPLKEILLRNYSLHEEFLKISKSSLPQDVFLHGNFLKHCNSTEEFAVHDCGGKFIPIYTNYNSLTVLENHSETEKVKEIESSKIEDLNFVLCINCKNAYFTKEITLRCNHCSVTYSSTIVNKEDFDLPLATWESYHCSTFLNDTMKCIKCKDEPFRLNLKSNSLECLKCGFKANPQNLTWTCFICFKDFSVNAKVYNKLEFSRIKDSIYEALVERKVIFPAELPCCKADLEKLTFFHKKSCRGVLLEGLLNGITIVVCELCKAMNYYSKFIWTCPICLRKFSQDTILLNLIESKLHPHEETKSEIKAKKGIIDNHNFEVKVSQLNEIELSKQNRTIQVKKNLNQSIDITGNSQDIIYESIKGISLIRYNKIIQKTQVLSTYKKNAETKTQQKCGVIQIKSRTRSFENLENEAQSVKIIKPGFGSPKIGVKPSETPTNKDFLNPFKDKKGESRNPQPSSKNEKIKIFEATKQKPQNQNIEILDHIEPNERNIKNLNINLNFVTIEGDTETNQERKLKTIDSNDDANSNDENKEGSIPFLNIEAYKIVQEIGEGVIGNVFLALDSKNEKYALKKINFNDSEILDYYVNEYQTSYSLNHPHILTIYGKCIKTYENSHKSLLVLTELAQTSLKKDVQNHLREGKYFDEKTLTTYLIQLTEALNFLQEKNISHRNLKPSNILIMKDGTLRLSDIGCGLRPSVESLENGEETFVSPLIYHSFLEGSEPTDLNIFKSDVYSLGLCFIYAATLKYEIISEIRNARESLELYSLLKKNLSRYSQSLINLIYRMIDINEELRLDFAELKDYLRKK